jgi:hypothetical protein
MINHPDILRLADELANARAFLTLAEKELARISKDLNEAKERVQLAHGNLVEARMRLVLAVDPSHTGPVVSREP